MRKPSKILLLSWTIWLVAGASAQTTSGESPAVRRAKELIQLINTDNRAAFRQYVTENFAETMKNAAPMEGHLGFYSSLRDR
jgi:hypothetical protein